MTRLCDYPGCESSPAFMLYWRGDKRRRSPVCDAHYRLLRTGACCWVEPLDGRQLKRGDERFPASEGSSR